MKRSFERANGIQGGISDLAPHVRHQFEKLKSSLILGATSGGPRTILFSSYNHGEGTSTIVANFAACLAQDKKYRTLVVDANTRKPGLDGIVSESVLRHDLVFSDIVSPEVSEPISLGEVSKSTFFLMRCGNTLYHPAQTFDHTRFVTFVNSAKEVFDFVILDSSPIGKYYDAIVLAARMDGVVLVTQAEKTPAHELRMAKRTLLEHSIPILGVVLNRRRFHIPQFVFDRFLR